MVHGLLAADWREVALREITARVFVLNLPGAAAALEAELRYDTLESAWHILWSLFDDFGLAPDSIPLRWQGAAATFARRSRPAGEGPKAASSQLQGEGLVAVYIDGPPGAEQLETREA